MSIRIVLADHHAIVLDGLQALLRDQPEIKVVGVANNGHQAVKTACTEAPDVVVIDISMPGLNGVEAARRIREQLPKTKVLCLTTHSDASFVSAMLQAGASGYILKDKSSKFLIEAIRAVAADKVYLCQSVAGTVVDAFSEKRSTPLSSAFSVLSGREREVLQMIAEGSTTKQIAARLHRSVKTISSHREHLMTKLNIKSVAGLTKYAIREGLTSTEPDPPTGPNGDPDETAPS